MQLYEKYRPKTLKEFVGQSFIIKRMEKMLSRKGWDRDAFWLQGPSGTGKTTLAKIIANRLTKTEFAIIEMDGDNCNAAAINDIRYSIGLYPGKGKWKVYIVNEAHAMSRQAVQGWLTLLEALPAYRLIVFTTTENIEEDLFGNFSHPFGSRVKIFKFTTKGLSLLFAKRAKAIAKKESLDGQPLKKYEYLIKFCKNNLRQALQRIDACEMM